MPSESDRMTERKKEREKEGENVSRECASRPGSEAEECVQEQKWFIENVRGRENV